MGEVLSLADERTNRVSHLSGEAICLDCGHVWIAVAPVVDGYMSWLECPACKLVRGRFKFPIERDGLQWRCQCDNDLFHLKV